MAHVRKISSFRDAGDEPQRSVWRLPHAALSQAKQDLFAQLRADTADFIYRKKYEPLPGGGGDGS